MRKRTKVQELIDFEIAFYEKLLGAYPEFVDALIPLAHAYTKRGYLDKGLDIDLRLIAIKGDDPLAWYNLTCSYSLLKQIDEAIESLRKAIEFGYRDMRYLQQDPDLLFLRQSPKFQPFMKSLAASIGDPIMQTKTLTLQQEKQSA